MRERQRERGGWRKERERERLHFPILGKRTDANCYPLQGNTKSDLSIDYREYSQRNVLLIATV